MVPFRVYDRAKKQMWVVIHQLADEKTSANRFLCAKEDDDAHVDGEMKFFSEKDLLKMHFVDFLEDAEGMYD